MIKNFIPRLAERGRIKIGDKGEMKTSQDGKQFANRGKLDHMVITTMQRERGRAAATRHPTHGPASSPGGGKITEIPVRLTL